MGRIEKTVFISYRRINFPWAQSIYQDLTNHGYDVFLDHNCLVSGHRELFYLGKVPRHRELFSGFVV